MLADKDADRLEVGHNRVQVATAAWLQVEVAHALSLDRFKVRAVKLENFLTSFCLRETVDAGLGNIFRSVTLQGVIAMDVSEELDTSFIVFNGLETAVRLTTLDKRGVCLRSHTKHFPAVTVLTN